MKKITLGFLSFLLFLGTVEAQDGKKMLKNGLKLLKEYSENAITNASKLDEGLGLLESAFGNDEMSKDVKNLNMLAEAYNVVAEGQINAKLLDPNYVISNGDLAIKALDTYGKVLGMAEKAGDIKDALAGLARAESSINNIGIYAFQLQDYATAFDYFSKAIDAYELIKSKGGASRLDDEVERKDHYFYTGAAGHYAHKGMAVAPILEKQVMEGTDKPLVYEALYSVYAATDATKAEDYLVKGREMFPDDTGLLFAEINHYLTQGKLDVLTDKLKAAVAKEPDNISIYSTLGNVYDQLNQKERAANNVDKADEYFAESLKWYTEATDRDANNFDAVYSKGALYYNKAASLTNAINALANDFTPAGTKKYDTLKAEMDSYFESALPFFFQAESLNGNDLNTLIALREIYARKNEMDKVSAYKARIDALTGQ